MSRITRRDFLTHTAMSLAGAGLARTAALGARQASSRGDADIIVVGAGLAGLAAAITAADDGASVLVVDKHYKIGGRPWAPAAVSARPDRGCSARSRWTIRRSATSRTPNGSARGRQTPRC